MEKQRVAIKMQRHLRPLTATPQKLKSAGSKDSELRPGTAGTGRSREENRRKSSGRQSLRKSHLQASGKKSDSDCRSRTGTPDLTPIYDSQVELEILAIVGAKNQAEESAPQPDSISPCLEQKNEQKYRHPSFETWLTGSPHSSDEFDTDVEEEMLETPVSSHLSVDATGKLEYEEQCKKHGFVPVSYLCRHIGERNVRMRHRYLGGTATKPLALAFKHNTVTENLDLSDNHIEGSGASYLATMLKENHFIVSLNLSNNCIGSLGAEAIAEMLEMNTTLKMLSLSGNQLSDSDAYLLINPLKNNMSLMTLDLSHNQFSVMGGLHLGGALGINEGLVELDLSWNSLRKHGAMAIANALKMNKTLEVLDLSWNGLGLEGAAALQKTLPLNTTLKVLDLTNNRLDTKAAQRLAPGLRKNVGLESLILSLNPLGDTGVELILKSVAPHPVLHFFAIEDIPVTQSNGNLIAELERDKDMIILHGGVGGFNRNSAVANVMQLFNKFRKKKLGELRDLFIQYDKAKAGRLPVDDIKMCLRSAGLSLTSRYLDLLVEDMDSTHQGFINYRNILSGEAFSEHSRRRPSRGFYLLSRAELEPEAVEPDTS